MIILGCDTSCDDTAIGIIQVINNKITILANIKISQNEMIEKYGGVVPEVSARTHLENIDQVLTIALNTANIQLKDVDIFSVTAGPGLISCLIIGYDFISTLAHLLNKPIYYIHHVEAHASVCFIQEDVLILIISGGHTSIIHRQQNKYKTICNTLDDAAGEVLDKIARELHLPFPYGPSIEQIANKNKQYKVIMKGRRDFSFAGLKTHCLNMVKDNCDIPDIAAFLQNSIAEQIKEKLILSIQHTSVKTIIVCGGVANNHKIRNSLQDLNCIFAPVNLCTDNGVMVAMNCYYRYQNNLSINIQPFSSMSLDDWSNLNHSNFQMIKNI